MRRKTLRTCLLVLGLLLGTSSSAYADAISITSVTVSNIQLVPTSGTIVFVLPQVGSRTVAHTVVVSGSGEELSDEERSQTRSEANTTGTFGSASAVSDFTNLFVSANSSVLLSGCRCDSEAEGLALLGATFMITGGTGNVDVNLSALLQTVQSLATDPFSFFAASDANLTLAVSHATLFSPVSNFAFTSNLTIGPNDSLTLEFQRQLSQVLTLQFDQPYNLNVFVRANSRAAQNEIPEPATVVMLVSGLGFMAGFVRKRRQSR